MPVQTRAMRLVAAERSRERADWIEHHTKMISLLNKEILRQDENGSMNDRALARYNLYNYVNTHFENRTAPMRKTHPGSLKILHERAEEILEQLTSFDIPPPLGAPTELPTDTREALRFQLLSFIAKMTTQA